MARTRVFHSQPVTEVPGAVWLDEKESHRLQRVLRLKTGAALLLTDSLSQTFEGSLIAFTNGRIEVAVHHLVNESPNAGQGMMHGRVKVFFALPRVGGSTGTKAKVDDLIFPVSELGAEEMVPMISEFSVAKPDAQKWLEKKPRLLRLTQESAKQCGRLKPLAVGDLTDFAHVLALPFDVGFILDPDPQFFMTPGALAARLGEGGKESPSVHLLIGPEGGFSHSEIKQAEKVGFVRLCFNSNILRTPTAILSALAVLGFVLNCRSDKN